MVNDMEASCALVKSGVSETFNLYAYFPAGKREYVTELFVVSIQSRS
jgi:hypothetical protein